MGVRLFYICTCDLLLLSYKFSLHCLTCENGYGPFKCASFASWHTGSFVSRGHWRHTVGRPGGFLGRLGELQFFFTIWPTWYSLVLSAFKVQLSAAFGHHMFSPAPDSCYSSIADSPRKNRTVPSSSHKRSQPHRHRVKCPMGTGLSGKPKTQSLPCATEVQFT